MDALQTKPKNTEGKKYLNVNVMKFVTVMQNVRERGTQSFGQLNLHWQQ